MLVDYNKETIEMLLKNSGLPGDWQIRRSTEGRLINNLVIKRENAFFKGVVYPWGIFSKFAKDIEADDDLEFHRLMTDLTKFQGELLVSIDSLDTFKRYCQDLAMVMPENILKYCDFTITINSAAANPRLREALLKILLSAFRREEISLRTLREIKNSLKLQPVSETLRPHFFNKKMTETEMALSKAGAKVVCYHDGLQWRVKIAAFDHTAVDLNLLSDDTNYPDINRFIRSLKDRNQPLLT